MSLSLDHVFVLCAAGGPEAETLARCGLEEGPSNTHPGQGTACRRFFFHNAYLELLWVHDAADARSEAVAGTRIWERWAGREEGASPFGIVMRLAGPAGAQLPFATWVYRPAYLPPDLSIAVAADIPLTEPGLFVLSSAHMRPAPARPSTGGSAGTELTGVRIGMPARLPLSDAARAAEAAGIVSFEASIDHVLHLTFDGGNGRREDLRPAVPISLQW